jgi:hypothetical protein
MREGRAKGLVRHARENAGANMGMGQAHLAKGALDSLLVHIPKKEIPSDPT